MVEPAVPAGRPRDPLVEDRVAVAAIELFGASGWSGFNIEAVARRAGVGKASIYLRWRSKEELLIAALANQVGLIEAVNTGSVRGDLILLARQLLECYLGPSGRARLRLGVEPAENSAIGDHFAAWKKSQVLAARAIVRRGIRRSELPVGTSETLLLDTLCGGAMMHALSMPVELRGKAISKSADYTESLVDFLLRAVDPSNPGPDQSPSVSETRSRRSIQ